MKRLNVTTKFTNIKDSTRADWKLIDESYVELRSLLPARLMGTLELLDTIQGALPVTRLEHSLQAATRAFRDNKDDQYIFTALFHDIGSYFTHVNHAEISAAMIRPYVRDDLHWMILHHEIFQSYHYFDQIGLNKNGRDEFTAHRLYQPTVEFCEKYDAPSWDKNYESKKLDDFYDLVDSVTKDKRR